jgi:LEA14-like dessication related protein
MRRILTRAGALLALLAVLVSCATGPKLEAPRLKVIGIEMLSTDMFAQRFKVRMLVQNPNDMELEVRGLDYQIMLMGDSFADGVSNDQFLLPALGEAEFDMMVTTNFVSSFGRLISRMGGGKLENIEYEIVGKIFVDKGMVKKIPFSHRGTVDFSRALGEKKGERTL